MYNLLIKGAHVVDPLNHVNGKADVRSHGGRQGDRRFHWLRAAARHHRQPRAFGQYVGQPLRRADARDEGRDDVPGYGGALGRHP